MTDNGKVDKTTYSEQIAGIVRERIRRGELKGGDHVSEAALAMECGISRAPVREGLYLLEAEGLVTAHPRKGKRITILQRQDIHDRYELCGILEGAAAASLLKAGNEDILPLLDPVLARMRQEVTTGGVDVLANLGTVFHETFLAPVKNRLVVDTARSACRIISKYLLYQQWRTLYTPQEHYDRHYAIYRAFGSGNPQIVENAIRMHYGESAERMSSFVMD